MDTALIEAEMATYGSLSLLLTTPTHIHTPVYPVAVLDAVLQPCPSELLLLCTYPRSCLLMTFL